GQQVQLAEEAPGAVHADDVLFVAAGIAQDRDLAGEHHEEVVGLVTLGEQHVADGDRPALGATLLQCLERVLCQARERALRITRLFELSGQPRLQHRRTYPRPSQSPALDLGEVAEREWYHTLELAPGVETPGYFDHRPILHKLPIPASLAGQRCL